MNLEETQGAANLGSAVTAQQPVQRTDIFGQVGSLLTSFANDKVKRDEDLALSLIHI